MDKANDTLLNEIRDSYTAMHTSLYLEYVIKIEHTLGNFIIKALNQPIIYDMNFKSGNKYILRKDYINKALESSKQTRFNWGLMGDMSIIHTFTNIASNFSELLKNASFKKFTERKFNTAGENFDSFSSIVRLIRNISVHGSLSKGYLLKKDDFSDWQKHQNKKGIERIKFRLNINNKESLNIDFMVSDLKEGFNFSSIFGGYEMIVFIELCTHCVFEYEKEIGLK